jgi:6-phosphogluconolactonase
MTLRFAKFLIPGAALLGAFLPAAPQQRGGKGASTQDWLGYVGTYTGPKSQGIYSFGFQASTGKMTVTTLAAATASPSFLAEHPNRRFLYSVNEDASAKVSAFAIEADGNRLKLLNQVSSKGAGPCHLTVDHTGKWLFVANYDGGSIASFPIHPDGTLGEAISFVQHTGHSADPERQREPHAHSVNLSPDNRFLLVTDLGLDQLLIYRLDQDRGTLVLNNPAFAKLAPGSGPRHLVFSKDGNFVYVINEMFCTVTVFRYDASHGSVSELQTLSTLDAGFKGEKSGAEIALHPSGKFLYASTRGANTVALFVVDPVKGTLTAAGRFSTGGKTPRNFAIDPTGTYLLAANQDSNNIVEFRIDQKSGGLESTGAVIAAGAPVCIIFTPAH